MCLNKLVASLLAALLLQIPRRLASLVANTVANIVATRFAPSQDEPALKTKKGRKGAKVSSRQQYSQLRNDELRRRVLRA